MAKQIITGNENGAEFIGKLNGNFSGGNGTVQVNAPLQGGKLVASTGYADGRWCEETVNVGGSWPSQFTYTDDDYNKYLHTPCYLSLDGNKVKSVTAPSGSTLSIFCYDDQFALLSGGVVNAVENIPDGAAYVKMQIYNTNGYASVLPLNMTLVAAPEWVKNSYAPCALQFHNYEVKAPKLWDTNYTVVHSSPTGAAVDIDNTRYHDNCYVMLPPNYDPKGAPVKFVMWFHGDQTAAFIAHGLISDSNGVAVSSIYKTNFDYLNNMGYAVVSCGGYTSMWSGEPGATSPIRWTPRISPAYVASVMGLYDFLMRNYNFDPRPYVAGKSGGGLMTTYLATMSPFGIRAAAGFSLGISMCNSLAQSTNQQEKSWQKRYGVSIWDDFRLNTGSYDNVEDMDRASILAAQSSDAYHDAQLLLDNEDYYRHYDPFTLRSDVEFDDYLRQILSCDPLSSTTPPEGMVTLLAGAHKVMPTPVKLWCSTKDPAVPYSFHTLYADWINANNGIAELRSYTGSDGSHSTFAGGTAFGGKVADVNTPQGLMEGVNIGFIEAVEWFKRW